MFRMRNAADKEMHLRNRMISINPCKSGVLFGDGGKRYSPRTRRLIWRYMSLVMRKPAFCICEREDADQLRGNREADQRLCFRYTDSTIPLLSESEISSI